MIRSFGRSRRHRREFFLLAGVCGLVLSIASCARDQALPPGDVDGGAEGSVTTRTGVDVVIDEVAAGVVDRRLLGSNLPAWIGPERLSDPSFQQATRESGVTFLRMPGGSWSNAYDWAGCEAEDPDRCYFVDSARPTDFIDFLQEVGLPGMWTLSANMTAQSAAAAVAFFNGEPDDARPIGVDRNGVDWATVGWWASVRAGNGNPAPFPIAMWEVGNEVFGGRPDAGGDECASFGWEDVWTCDGREYMLGDEAHDGFLDIRAAMLAVDPTIDVGAVGVSTAADWNNWGNEVIDLAGDDLDFYIVHAYGFDASPDADAAVQRPAELWPDIVSDVESALGPDIPMAITEYNLVSFEAGDVEHRMTQVMNALYVADTIGQLATGGVGIASQWNLANGTTGSGTDYGLISADTGARFPQFEAMRMWSRTGSELLSAAYEDDTLRVYPTRHGDGRITVLVLNLSGAEVPVTMAFSSAVDVAEATTVWASGPEEQAMIEEVGDVTASERSVEMDLRPWSISVVEVGS